MYGGKGFYAMQAAGGGSRKTIVNPIMLRFRPIAPKPVAGTSGSGEAQPEKSDSDHTKGRRKRKYVRGKRNNSNRCKTKNPGNGNEAFDRTVPEQPVCSAAAGSNGGHDVAMVVRKKLPVWLNFDGKVDEKSTTIDHIVSNRSDLTDLMGVLPPSVRAAESWVTVECVTDCHVFHRYGGLGKTDVERMKNLEVDTCPAFVSDGSYSVRWINRAYQEMMEAVEEEEAEGGERWSLTPETAVKLVVKEGLPAEYPAFACRVTVEYYTMRTKRSRTMPCDVWKMDYGGFAWRLDVQTALSLGR